MPALHGTQKMKVVVDQPRHHRSTLEVNHPGRRSGHILQCRTGASGNNAFTTDGQRLHNREACINGQYLSVEQQRLGTLDGILAGILGAHRCGEDQPAQHQCTHGKLLRVDYGKPARNRITLSD